MGTPDAEFALLSWNSLEMNPTLVLVLLALVAASSGKPTVGVEPYMYFPCETQVREGDGLVVECPFYNIPELIRQAFTRNAPNNNLVSLHMHSDFEGTVLDYITDSSMLSGSYDTLKEFQLSYTPNPSFPKLLSKLTALEHLHLDHVPIEHVEAGYLKLGSPESLKVLSISNAPLYTFEAGAFPEGFRADVVINHDNITALNGAAFKPLLQTGANLSFDSRQIKCDCDLSWLCRDGRDMLDQVEGSCLNSSGELVAVQDTDAEDFSSCP